MWELIRGRTVGRLGLDMVVILDVSGSMQGKKIQAMKTTMKFIIDKLRPIDRLSIVTFSATAARLCPLRLITETSQSELQGLIDSLTASGDTANIIEGLQSGLKVLSDRKVSRCRVAAVMIMSDGLQINRGSRIVVDGSDVPVYTFGFGADHDPTVLHEVAEKSNGGTFSAVNQDMDRLSLPFSKCLDNLLTIVVQNLRFMVEREEKEYTLPIKVITDGRHPQAQDTSHGSVTVRLSSCYSSEVHNITVNLILPAIKSKHSTEIFKITYSYSTVGELFVVPPSTLAVWHTSTGMAVLEKEKPPSAPMEETQVHQMVKKTWTEVTTSSHGLSYSHPERPPARAWCDYDIIVKLLLAGDSGVGKSSLLLQFTGGSFTISFITTNGTAELEGKRVKFQIWDVTGQERFQTLSTAYYREAMGVLLVYDVTDESSFNSIREWTKNIEEHAPHVNKILVGNRSDMDESKKAVPTSRGQALADEYGIEFFETSAKTYVNVDQAFFSLVRDVMERLSPPETDSMPMDPTIKVVTSRRRRRNPLAYALQLFSKKR